MTFNTLRMSPCPSRTRAWVALASRVSPSLPATCSILPSTCRGPRGANRKRVQRDWRAGMILLT